MIEQLKKDLFAKYKYRTELHAHTNPVSGCSNVSPKEMAKIYHEQNYDALVITNHFFRGLLRDKSKEEIIDAYIKSYEETAEYAKEYGLKVILGAELRFTENTNDYLLFGVDRDILSFCYDWFDKGVEKFRKETTLERSVFIQAHPFRNNMELVDPQLLDGIEIFNLHPNHNSRIAMATKYAHENNIKIRTAGTDFHHKDCGHEGLTALRTTVLPEDSFDLAQILKSGDYVFEVGKNTIVLP